MYACYCSHAANADARARNQIDFVIGLFPTRDEAESRNEGGRIVAVAGSTHTRTTDHPVYFRPTDLSWGQLAALLG